MIARDASLARKKSPRQVPPALTSHRPGGVLSKESSFTSRIDPLKAGFASLAG